MDYAVSKYKIFPIKTKTACALKWEWSTVFLNDGTTSSCSRVGRHPVSLEEFDNFHNIPEKIKQRETMLQGEWPQPEPYLNADDGCRYCEKIEAAGGQSDRQFHLQVPDLTPKELDQEPWATKVTPTILELFINNTCNLACTYCHPQNSSQIEAENIKFGHFEKNGLVIKSAEIDRTLNSQYIDRMFSWMENNSNELRRLHILGGEPFYIKEFYRLLDFFQEHPNPNLEFNLISNFMVDSDKLAQVLDTMRVMTINRCVKRFDITVSLDCWGPEQELARWGLKLDQLERNFEQLLDKPWIYVNIQSALSPLTIKRFPDLIEKIKHWKKHRKVQHHFQPIFSPAYHNPDIFGPEFWQKDLDKALSLMPRDEWQEKIAYDYLKGIISQIQNGCKKPDLVVKFKTHLDELDRRRGTNWRSLFPYLDIE